MDCRIAYGLGFGLLVGLAGCTPQGTLPLAPAPDPTQVAIVHKEEPKSCRTPRPACDWATFAKTRPTPQAGPRPSRSRCGEQARLAYQQTLSIDPTYLPASLSLARLYRRETIMPVR